MWHWSSGEAGPKLHRYHVVRHRHATTGTVLILVQNLPVPFDRRVWQEAKALTAAGYDVHVIGPRTAAYPRRREVIEGISIYRYSPGSEARNTAGYVREYGIALWSMLVIALRLRMRRRIDIVQVCNPPDVLFVPALPLVLTGAALIYDHHDACPELLAAKGTSGRAITARIVRLLERITYRIASVSIETNHSYRNIALTRGRMSAEDVFVVRSAPEASRFADATPDPIWRRGRKHLVAYVGVMAIQEGLDYLLDAAAIILHEYSRDDVQFVCVGSGSELSRLRDRAYELGVGSMVEFTGRLPDRDLGTILATADVCVNPDEANEMNDISTMNKIMEYMALGKPIVQFDLHEGRFSAGDASLYAVRNDARSLADCLLELVDDRHLAARMGEVGRDRLMEHLSWEAQVPILLAAYQRASAGR